MNRIYGLTIEGTDDTDDGVGINLLKLLSVLGELPRKPVLRICLEFGIDPQVYEPYCRALRGAGYPLMLQPVDSQDMHRYSVSGYAKRFTDSLAWLGHYSDYVEVANEFNGDWCGLQVLAKLNAAGELIADEPHILSVKTVYVTERWKSYDDVGALDINRTFYSVYPNAENEAKSFLAKDFRGNGIGEYGTEDGAGNKGSFEDKRTLIQMFETRAPKSANDLIGGFYWDFYDDCVKGTDPKVLDVFKTVWA